MSLVIKVCQQLLVASLEDFKNDHAQPEPNINAPTIWSQAFSFSLLRLTNGLNCLSGSSTA